MEPENRNLLADAPQDDNEATAQVVETAPLDPFSLPRFGPPPGNLRWAFAGSQGLRPGWLALAQLALILLFGWVLTSIARAVHPFKLGDSSLFAVSVEILALYAAIFGSNALTSLVRSRGLRWVFIGPQRLRAGWSVALFASIIFLVIRTIRLVVHLIHPGGNQGASGGDDFTAGSALIGEFLFFVLLFFAAWIVSLVERRSVMDYNLSGPRRPYYFFSGFIAGFLALSALVAALDLGGWLHFGPIALSGPKIFEYAAVWGLAFLFVGLVEEGSMRCFLLSTLTRGINFWWALGIIGAICLDLVIRTKGNGVWGVYVIALMGLGPCLWLHLKKSPGAGFWQAAWVTSTFFGFGHTSNNGENWIGIFAAAAIGFVFCVSVRVTGSAWWAIGCHAAWDWAETYFYGTADSGFVAKGHFLTTTTGGNPLWSGGTDGPEGSLLVIAIVVLLLAAVLALYGRKKKQAPMSVPALEQALS